MFKFILYLSLILVFIDKYESKFYKKGRLNDISPNDEEPWPNLYFPHPTNYEQKVSPEVVNVAMASKTNFEDSTDNINSSNWNGLWFPHPPNYQSKTKSEIVTPAETDEKALLDKKQPSDKVVMRFPPKYGSEQKEKKDAFKLKDNIKKSHECDNGKDYIAVDFDPEDKRHSFNYLCFGNRSEYGPNLNTSALLEEFVIPAAYEPPLKCLDEHIEYSDTLPTFGAFRPMAPKFGSYKYLPPQRWLHSLADGAIILLYHPCAFAGQIERLQNTLKGCLYRHIITPSQQLTPQRPLALLAWGKSLQMSVVDDAIVVKFIRENAKMGFRQKQQKLKMPFKLYDAGLSNEARLVTDEQDIEICGYKEMR